MSSGLAKSEVIAFASEVIALASAALFFAADTPVNRLVGVNDLRR